MAPMEKFNSDHIYTLMARRLSGEATPEELGELDSLLRANPTINYSLEILQDIWKSQEPVNRRHTENKYKELEIRLKKMGIDDNQFNSQDDYIINDEPRANSKKRPRRILFASVLLVVTACMTIAFYNGGSKKAAVTPPNLVATKYGSKTRLLLSDGTAVTLNADSKLEYPENFEGNIREVRLEGEAFFEVAHNGKPFIIRTHAMDIKVLGTVFNVKAYTNERTSEASLIKGSIEVTLNNEKKEKVILKPNEKISVANTIATAEPAKNTAAKNLSSSTIARDNEPEVKIDKLMPDIKENVIKEIAWTQNKLMFKNEKLEDIAVLLKRWYGQDVILKNEDLKDLKFTGTYYQENLEEVLQSLQMANSFKMKNENNSIVIY